MKKIEDLKNKRQQVQEEVKQEVQKDKQQKVQETNAQNTQEQTNANAEVAQTNPQNQVVQENKRTYANVVKIPAKNLKKVSNLLDQKGGQLKVTNEISTQQLQTFLDRCYNLENLYLIKHYEVMEILKPIVYYLDVLGKNTLLFVYVLSMYGKEETISGETLDKEISFLPEYKNFITKINDLLKDQKKIDNIMKDIKKGDALKQQNKNIKNIPTKNSSSSQNQNQSQNH